MAFFIRIQLQVASVAFISFLPWARAHVSDSGHFSQRQTEIHKRILKDGSYPSARNSKRCHNSLWQHQRQSQASWVHGAPDEGDNDKRELLRSSNHPDEINGRERNLRFLKDADLHSKLLFGFIALCSQRFQNVQFPSVCPDKGQREVCRLPNGAKLRTVSTWLWKVFGSMNLHDIQSARSSQVITDPNEEAGMLAASFPCPPAQLLCTAC